MKKLMIFASLIACSLVISPVARAQNVNNPEESGVVMQGGKMMEVKGNNVTPMEKDIVLRNGSTITTTGTLITKDGKQLALKEGQRIDMSGNFCNNKKLEKDYKLKSDRMPTDAKTVDQRTK